MVNSNYSVNLIATNKFVNSTIYLYLENFKSPGGNGLIFTGQPTIISYELRFISLFKTGIKTNKDISIADSTAIDVSSSQEDYNDSTATGKLTVFLTNSIPINVNFQMYFYDESRTVFIDSLYYGNLFVPAGNTDTDGAPLSSEERKFEIPLSAERLSKLRQSKFAYYRIYCDTYGKPGSNVTAGSQCSLTIQITGDLKIKVAKLFNLSF